MLTIVGAVITVICALLMFFEIREERGWPRVSLKFFIIFAMATIGCAICGI